MKFSVLISVYKKEKPSNLDASLKSIWDDQILKPDEIVLVKDGQLTQELDELIANWEVKLAKVLKIVELRENIGLGRALNIGIDFCSNDLIARMDSDDISLPNRFEAQINFLRKHSDIVLLGCQISEFQNEPFNITGNRIVPCSHENIKKYSKIRCPFTHPTIMFKKNAIKSVGGYKHHYYMEDYNLFLRIIAKGFNTANLDKILLLVRSGDDALSRRKGLKYIHSEWVLANLKYRLKIQSFPSAFGLFIIRSIPRLLPAKLMPIVYSFLRK